jgi:hypothetical protein
VLRVLENTLFSEYPKYRFLLGQKLLIKLRTGFTVLQVAHSALRIFALPYRQKDLVLWGY